MITNDRRGPCVPHPLPTRRSRDAEKERKNGGSCREARRASARPSGTQPRKMRSASPVSQAARGQGLVCRGHPQQGLQSPHTHKLKKENVALLFAAKTIRQQHGGCLDGKKTRTRLAPPYSCAIFANVGRGGAVTSLHFLQASACSDVTLWCRARVRVWTCARAFYR